MNKVQGFYNAIHTDVKLKSKLDSLNAIVSSKEMNEIEAETFIVKKVLPIAKEFGFDITFPELLAYESSVSELNDEELVRVSGGTNCTAERFNSIFNKLGI